MKQNYSDTIKMTVNTVVNNTVTFFASDITVETFFEIFKVKKKETDTYNRNLRVHMYVPTFFIKLEYTNSLVNATFDSGGKSC